MNKKIIFIVITVALVALAFFVFMPKKTAVMNPKTPVVSSPIVIPETTPLAGVHTISIKDFAFSPNTLTITAGESVEWTNEDSAPHQISGTGFLSDILSTTSKYRFTFHQKGTFEYHCSIHPSMKGKVIVE